MREAVIAANTRSGSDTITIPAGSAAGLTSGGYNYFSTMSGCSITTVGTDDTTTGPASFVATALPEDNGGVVETLRIWGTSFNVDVVPVEACLDAAGAALTTDARGASRPQGAACDFGAYEKDETNPTVTATAGDDAVECGIETWTNAGATVSDNISTGLTASSSGSVAAGTIASYPITYTSTSDIDGNIGSVVRTVTVADTRPPTVTLAGSSSVSVAEGAAYTDAGATATDVCDSSVSVATTNPVNTAVPGTYTVTYNASDDTNNAATAVIRTVTVTTALTETPTETEDVVDHGDITKLTQTDNRLKITYADETTETITPYGASDNFRTALSTDKERVIVTNGKDIRVFVNGERVTKKIIGTKTLSRVNYRVSVKKVYNGYDSVFIATARQKTARVYALRLTTSNTLTKQKSQAFSIQNLSKPTLSVNSVKKQVTVAYGKSGQRVKRTWKLQKDGDFSLVK